MFLKVAATLFAPLLIVLTSCSRRQEPPPQLAVRQTVSIADGLVYRFYPRADRLSPVAAVHVLDIDLSKDLEVSIAADNTELHKGVVYGDTFTLPEWIDRKGALAGVNGGFFGQSSGGRKEIVGLLAREGHIDSSGSLRQSPKAKDRKFVRSVFALDEKSSPHIGWMTGRRGTKASLADHDRPLNPTNSTRFEASAAMACGPRLVANGDLKISDSDEKLGSPESVPRTFVAFSRTDGKPVRLILCVTPAMTYADCAAFVQRYFREVAGSSCAEAMCLDGGSSSQMSYRKGEEIVRAYPTGVSVPTAVLVVKR
jgi:exopolysaccharide biosynthesis protein